MNRKGTNSVFTTLPTYRSREVEKGGNCGKLQMISFAISRRMVQLLTNSRKTDTSLLEKVVEYSADLCSSVDS